MDVVDKSFVVITGPKDVSGVRRRRANTNHIEPLQERIDINRGASDEEVTEALKAANKLENMAQIVMPHLS